MSGRIYVGLNVPRRPYWYAPQTVTHSPSQRKCVYCTHPVKLRTPGSRRNKAMRGICITVIALAAVAAFAHDVVLLAPVE